MDTLVKRLTFKSKDLGVDVDLLLTFDEQPDVKVFKDYYPSAFAVRRFGAEGAYRSEVIYQSPFAFTKVHLSSGDIQSVAEVAMQPGQTTTLTKEGDIYHFSDPKIDPSVKSIQCLNDAPSKEDIGFGFIGRDGDRAKTALVWLGVGHEQKVNVGVFQPVLRGYNGTGYKENSLIKS
ncbi:uncharacterized protein EDB93DRAFT_1269708 [Suillus bovinus]|uniref:uncharacterized protein n=1 Tax=Suillus bovinus TaxID=48563 RepID=UPI001B873ECD|nr:uncharacterized protein EDB93DRAFT_1269708 [Suillus bovinus]KAG2154310.1 hypothetical protein EDB93DRAFT_1269708 [Suillus bovinus]